MTAALSLAQVTKACGETLALARASFVAEAGEIAFVCGENGAGKTTLLKIAAGLLEPDAGEVRLFGQAVVTFSPAEGRRRGVAMVLQHFSLADALTGLENLVLGAEPTRLGGLLLDWPAARRRAKVVEGELGVTLPLDTPVGGLGVGDRQRLEIARGLYRGARILILDEPTAVLTKQEADALYGLLGRLAAAGRAVVVVSHKLDEVRAHGARAMALRRGRVVGEFDLSADRAKGALDASMRALRIAVMGDSTESGSPRVGASAVASAVEESRPRLSLRASALLPNLAEFSLEVHDGEVVGVAGVQGNGQSELVALLAGTTPAARAARAASVRLDDRPAVDRDFAVVHADRHKEGLVLDASVAENAALSDLARFSTLGALDVEGVAHAAAERLACVGSSIDVTRAARSLSGGNQQKVVVARALAKRDAKVLVLAEPTRGVDVGAARTIHDAIRAHATGRAVLVVSSDIDELRAVADRIVVLSRGRIAGEFPITATDAELGRAMLGHIEEGTVA